MAKGSHKVWGGWEPRVCCFCGNRVTLNHRAGHSFGPPARSWHDDCKPPVLVLLPHEPLPSKL